MNKLSAHFVVCFSGDVDYLRAEMERHSVSGESSDRDGSVQETPLSSRSNKDSDTIRKFFSGAAPFANFYLVSFFYTLGCTLKKNVI